MRRHESHGARDLGYVGHIGLLLCALLFVAPCSAADGRWLPDLITEGERATSARSWAPRSPHTQQETIVVLAPGVVSPNLARPKPPLTQELDRTTATPVRCVSTASCSVPLDEKPAQPLYGRGGRDVYLRVCALLI